MELNVLEQKKQRLVFELDGADHTLCNALKTALWDDKDVSIATYTVKHPLLAVPKFILETKKGDALKVLRAALGRLQKEYKSFATTLTSV